MLEFDLLRDAQRVVDLDAEITNRAFQLRMPEQQLNGSQVARLLVNLCYLGSPHRVRSVGRAIKSSTFDPLMHDACVLPGRDVRMVMNPAWEKILPGAELGVGHPVAHRGPRLLGNLELDGPACFLLDHSGAVPDMPSYADVVDPEPHQIASAQLAIEGEIEQSEIAATIFKLQPNADRPDLLRFERALLADEAPCSTEIS
jgi:hypothetical protein